jgi:hypothetical protein
MALIDLKSEYGPTNSNGKKGTGKQVDLLGYETGTGVVSATSKYALATKPGTAPARYGDQIFR